MSAYTVEWVGNEPERWTGNYGPMVTWRLRLTGHENIVELNQKPETPAPVVGQTLEGTVEQREFGNGGIAYRFKKAQQQGSFSGTGGRSGGRQNDPDQDRRIQRQWSLKAALALASEARERGITVDQCFDHIRALADRMESEIQSVAAPAATGRTPEPPVPSEGPLAGDSGNGQAADLESARGW